MGAAGHRYLSDEAEERVNQEEFQRLQSVGTQTEAQLTFHESTITNETIHQPDTWAMSRIHAPDSLHRPRTRKELLSHSRSSSQTSTTPPSFVSEYDSSLKDGVLRAKYVSQGQISAQIHGSDSSESSKELPALPPSPTKSVDLSVLDEAVNGVKPSLRRVSAIVPCPRTCYNCGRCPRGTDVVKASITSTIYSACDPGIGYQKLLDSIARAKEIMSKNESGESTDNRSDIPVTMGLEAYVDQEDEGKKPGNTIVTTDERTGLRYRLYLETGHFDQVCGQDETAQKKVVAVENACENAFQSDNLSLAKRQTVDVNGSGWGVEDLKHVHCPLPEASRFAEGRKVSKEQNGEHKDDAIIKESKTKDIAPDISTRADNIENDDSDLVLGSGDLSVPSDSPLAASPIAVAYFNLHIATRPPSSPQPSRIPIFGGSSPTCRS